MNCSHFQAHAGRTALPLNCFIALLSIFFISSFAHGTQDLPEEFPETSSCSDSYDPVESVSEEDCGPIQCSSPIRCGNISIIIPPYTGGAEYKSIPQSMYTKAKANGYTITCVQPLGNLCEKGCDCVPLGKKTGEHGETRRFCQCLRKATAAGDL